MSDANRPRPSVARSGASRPTPGGGNPRGTPTGGLNWLPPERSGPPLPRIGGARKRGFRVPAWAAVLASVACLAVIGWNIRRMYIDDTAVPDRIRVGSEIGVELAQRHILRYRARHGRWPATLADVDMDGWALTYRAEDNRFDVSGSDGAGGVIRRSGTVDDVPRLPDASPPKDSP
ncbi:MAG: hypothetical protein MUF53_05550 [Gemmatimonadaceae bacterium]|nr:hypothetical protein [Gemmatimonadaceae bacterium]